MSKETAEEQGSNHAKRWVERLPEENRRNAIQVELNFFNILTGPMHPRSQGAKRLFEEWLKENPE